MNYENANNILPPYIIEIIQEYIDGKYLYIPRKSENKKSWGEESGFREELLTCIINNKKLSVLK